MFHFSEKDEQTTKRVDYSKMPPIFGGRVVDDRSYSERPSIYDPNFYKKPVIKNERKENIIIKPSSDEVSIINKVKLEEHVLEVENIGFGYYSVLTPFRESQQSALDVLIKHLKDTYVLDEAYHDKVVQLKLCQP